MYSPKFKIQVIEEFRKCPHFQIIANKYNIDPETLRRWVKEKEINIEELREKYNEEDYFATKDPEELEKLEMYKAVRVIDEEILSKDTIIEFEINGYKIKLESRYLKEFIKELKR